MRDGRVESLEDFLRELENLRRQHVEEFRGSVSSLTFYRGHANKDWELTPRLYREGLHHEEQNMLADAQRLVPSEFLGDSEFRMLSKMQHFGLPTRLLDVTSNPLVALYFACLDPTDADGEVLIIPNLPTFSESGYMVPILMAFAFRGSWSALDLDSFSRDVSHHLPLRPFTPQEQMSYTIHALTGAFTAVSAAHANTRLRAQSGSFLLFGMEEESRTVSTNPGTKDRTYVTFKPASLTQPAGINADGTGMGLGLSLEIPAAAKQNILKQLNHIDVNRWRLFPEIEHAMRYVHQAYSTGSWHSFRGWRSPD